MIFRLCLLLGLACGAGSCQSARVDETTDAIVLRNERLALLLGKPQKGCITSLVDVSTGSELVAGTGSDWLFLVAVTKADGPGDDKTYLSSSTAASVQFVVENQRRESRVRMRFADVGGRGIDAECTASVRRRDPFVRWRVVVDMPEGLVVEEVLLPGITLRAPLHDGLTDMAVTGHTKGGVFRAPSAWEENWSTSASLPGAMAAQFACYYDESVGLYSAAHDSTGYPKRVALRRSKTGIEVSWGESCFAAGRHALDYDVVMTTFSGGDAPTDWRHAADIYKVWAEEQAWCAKTYHQRDDIPDWMKQGAPFVRFSRGWLSRPEQIERWLTDYWKRQFPEDLPLTIAYWGWEKVASWVTPDYFPLYPSDDEFIALAAMNREIGGHVFPWPSGYHYTMTFEEQADGSFTWDDRERFNRVARDHAVHKRNGDLYVRKASWLQGGANACMCPGDPFTIDWMNDIADELAECGADMIQVDQVVGGAFPACYKTDHPHPPGPGAWQAEVFRTQLKTMLARLREIEPDAVVSFEEPNEHFIQYAAIQDYRDIEGRWGDPRPDELASVFNYIYHEYLPTFQSNPRRGNGFLTAYCLVNGQTPHFVPTQDIGAGPLLAGGDFEEWADDQPRGWEKVGGYQGAVWNGKCARDETVKHSGDSSMRLENGADESVQVSRNVIIGDSFRRGRTYRVSAWIRTEDLAQVNGVNFGTLTHQLKSTGAGARIDMPAGTDDWARGDITLTIPEGTDFLRIMCHVDGPGKVWVDDVLLEEAGADGAFAEVRRPETPPDHDIMSRWVDLYSDEARPYLLFGRTLHPPKLECDSMEHGGSTYPAVLHNAYRAPDGSEAAILANATNEAQSATLQWHGDTVHLSLDPWEARLVR